MSLRILTAVACALLIISSAQAGELSRGALLASQCAACHGTDGKGAKPMPSINGLSVADMLDFMKAFASQEEKSTIMYRHAPGYTDDELKAMAEYLKDK
jgi:sulfide dehydrogenase cytochrome subunit